MKYIVEFEDEPCMYEDEVHFYKCIQAPWWGLSERVIKQLTPYQPDAPDTNVGNITNLCAHENDPISRQMAIDTIMGQPPEPHYPSWYAAQIEKLPAAQPDHNADISEINKFIDGLEEILADIRERHVDDSVCGLCEYDGAYMGQSGDWCNECPGFDKDDCFKLSDETRKKWIEEIVNTYPDHTADIGKKVSISCGRENDLISRQAAIDAAKHAWAKGLEPSQYIEIIPPAQPEPHWIPCTERMPHNTGDFYLCTAKLSVDDEYEVELLMLDTANDFDKSYFSKCIHNGLVFRESWSGGNEALDVIAWMPLPEHWREATSK